MSVWVQFTEYPIGAPIVGEVWVNLTTVYCVDARIAADGGAYTEIHLAGADGGTSRTVWVSESAKDVVDKLGN